MDDVDCDRFLAEHPKFHHTMHQFSALHDAAEALDQLKPPHGDTAAEFLREVGNHVMREAAGEEFLQALIRARPPLGSAR